MPNQIDLNKFKNVLPYASELFGLYQPLLGWKSQRTIQKFYPGVKDSQLNIVQSLLSKMAPDVGLKFTDATSDNVFFETVKLNVGTARPPDRPGVSPYFNFLITDLIKQRIISQGFTRSNIKWDKLVGQVALTDFLSQIRGTLTNTPTNKHDISFILNNVPADLRDNFNFFSQKDLVTAIIRKKLENESSMAGTLAQLLAEKKTELLNKIFFTEDKVTDVNQLDDINTWLDPMENFDPKTDIGRVSLSPIGIVHLFRQYFFEFDTFLGSPVQHIWLSPGSSLELVEIHTRKKIEEQTAAASTETTLKSESSSTDQDDISDAIKDENQNNSKFGISVNAGGTVTGGAPGGMYSATGHVDTTTSHGLESNQKTAKENAHKHMRQQSDKLSSEIKKNYKTTFRTITEVQDTVSKRYVLQNTTQELINYELRRKMRQVGVQVQDIGTSLCWQTYVDLPGNDLGIANLVHIAEPPDFASIPHPEKAAMPPTTISKDTTMKLDMHGFTDRQNDTNRTYVEISPGNDEGGSDAHDAVHLDYPGIIVEQIPLYVLQQVLFDGTVDDKMVEPVFSNYGKNTFDIHLKQVCFDGGSVTLKLKLIYSVDPKVSSDIDKKYQQDIANYTAEKAKLVKETLINEARERIKVASKITARDFTDLREEERTIVYRHLISELMNVGLNTNNNPELKHIMAELVNSLFDVDKMLYFTAPEWWVPRSNASKLMNIDTAYVMPDTALGKVKQEAVLYSSDTVSWSGPNANNRPNYYITEDSDHAKLGSSLGWMLQLDGDNIRNAFLNAPWVKAVIPIKPGKELAALNWLTKANVEGASGLTARYQEGSQNELNAIISFLEKYPFSPEDPRKKQYNNFSSKIDKSNGTLFVTIQDALVYLSLKIKIKNDDSNKPIVEKIDGDLKSYLPTDKVFEHGFDPLQGGFTAETTKQFEIFDQWVEVLPTDQIVAVEVKYDPKTGRQI